MTDTHICFNVSGKKHGEIQNYRVLGSLESKYLYHPKGTGNNKSQAYDLTYVHYLFNLRTGTTRKESTVRADSEGRHGGHYRHLIRRCES